MREPLVSIVTINYNQYQITREFLKSLSLLNYQNYEVIVIDNASVEDHCVDLQTEFPRARVFRTKQNLGFTGGNNIGIKLAKGEYFLVINNDTEIIKSDFLHRLLEPFEKDASIGMVSPKIWYYDRPGVIQFAGYNKINPFTGRNSQVGDGEMDKGQYDQSGYTHYANGAAMLVKKEVVDKVGVFYNTFFLCYEELDWSAQTTKNGFTIYYQADTLLLHKESMSIGKISPLKTYYNNRNRILFMRRNSDFWEQVCFFGYYAIFTIPKNTISFLLRFQFQHLASFFKGIIWNLRHISIFRKAPFHTRLEDVSLDSLQKSKI
jgi:GT2 family glycosyltransferase